jgi:beta-glucosidase
MEPRRRTHRLFAAISVVFASHTFAAPPATQSGTQPVEQRVNDLLGRMTLEEKITLLGGIDSMWTRKIERLGIPQLKFTDGPNGTRCWGKSTAYPAGVLLAATWDPVLAQREGEQLGRDAKSRECHVLLAPGMNIYRHPRNGRNFEYFGEDPLLAGEIAVGYVRGVESQGVSATIKHFATNNQETDRMTGSTEIDERTLREIYLPAFKRVIDQAKPGALMCAYNRINGTWASEHGWLLVDLLRDEWKFDGVVMSDWGAVHGTIGPLNSGLDLEMPDPKFVNLETVKPLLDHGVVQQAAIDTKVRRLLTWMARYGWLDRKIGDESIPKDNPDGERVSLDVARAGLTLLKNDGGLLPLNKSNVKRIAVVGPNALKTPVGGGGSGYTDPFRSVSIADGMKAALGEANVDVFIGDPIEKLALTPGVDGGTFKAEYFENKTLEGEPKVTTEVKTIDFEFGSKTPIAEGMKPGQCSARYRATITPAQTRLYSFFTHADDGARVLIDGKALIDDWSDHAERTRAADVTLEQGKKYEVVIEYYDGGGAAIFKFGCGPKAPAFEEAELAAIHAADTVVACVGFNSENESEGSDRTYELPSGQDDVLAQVIAQNPKTIVVLNAGGSVDMTKWIDKTPALLHAYYAGQSGGTAIAEVLFGDVNPSGRLPFTIEKQLADIPSEGIGAKRVRSSTRKVSSSAIAASSIARSSHVSRSGSG